MEKINVNFSELNNGYEIFWILLSIFDLPIEHQKNVIGIGFFIPQTNIPNLYVFRCCLYAYYDSWISYFDFLTLDEECLVYSEDLSLFLDAIHQIDVKDCIKKNDITNEKWKLLRKLGLKLLELSNLPKLTTEELIPYENLIRIFINENGDIQLD